MSTPAGFFGSLFLGPKKAIHIVIEIARNRDRSYGSSSWWQTCGAVLNFICHFAIIFGSVYFTLLDASVYFSWTNIPSIGDALSFLGRIVQHYPNRIQVGDLLGNLPGRAVALTFGLIASRYYANIYSSIEVRDLETSFQKIANFLLRANSISYLPPILYAIVIDPHAWPACAFLGTLFPALNNWACWKVANAAIEKTRGRFSSETYHHSEERIFLNGYKEWSLMMFGYSIGIALIGGALYAGWAHDEWIYALLVCGINIAKIYRINCGTEAPRILGHLSRYFFYVRRLAAYRLRHPQPQTA